MKFYMPVSYYLEENCIKNHKKEILECGKKPLIVTGKHSSKLNGSLYDLISILEDYALFDQVNENPTVNLCEKGARMGLEQKVDYVIGLGGGSSMDAAKAIALLIKNPDENKDCFYQKKELSHLDVICIPTTCGTGSEVTSKAVLSRPELHEKGSISHDIWPKYAFVDETYLTSASDSLIVSTAVDAFAHLIESHLNKNKNSFSLMCTTYGLSLFKEMKEELIHKEFNYKKLMMTSSIAGLAIAQTGTSIPHAMSYDLTNYFHISHGLACGYYLVSFVEVVMKKSQEGKEILSLLGFSDFDEFRNWMESLIGKPDLNQKEFLIELMNQKKAKWSTACVNITKEDICFIVHSSL